MSKSGTVLMKQLELLLVSNEAPPCSFKDDAYLAAKSILEQYNEVGLTIIALRQSDDLQDELDQAYWIEVRRAYKYIQAKRNYWLKGHPPRFPMM
jgi:hypothetical protein